MGRHGLAAVAVCLVVAACGADTVMPSASTGSTPLPPTSSPAVANASLTPSPTPVAAAPCEERALAFDPANLDLTGAWLGDDGGIYYLRQIGKTVWWSGMSDQAGPPDRLGRAWNNLAVGKINADLTIDLDWADVPRGHELGKGTMTWAVEEAGGEVRLRLTTQAGSGFGGSFFTPCAPG